jgi:polysaccharide export outer membrane protein
MLLKVQSLSSEDSVPVAGRGQLGRRGEILLLMAAALLGGLPVWGQAPATQLPGPNAPSMVQPDGVQLEPGQPLRAETPTQVRVLEYLVSPEDLLEMAVFDVPELSRDYRVNSHGMIIMPLLATPIPAAGLTLEQLAARVSERLRTAGLVTNPQVTVSVKESRAHAIAVVGAVRMPQTLRVLGRTTFLDVVSQAGGFTEDVGSTAIITRGEMAMRTLGLVPEGEERGSSAGAAPTVTVDLKHLMNTGDSNLNPVVYPGDRVTVQRAGVIYVVGAVNRPGGFTLKSEYEEMTVLKALALADNAKVTAQQDKAMILRKNPQKPGARDEIPVKLKQIMANRAPDLPLYANDILFVPDSAGKKALRRAADAAVGFATAVGTGMIIYRR